MKKKIILILTALLFVCVLFVACDKKDNNEQPKTVYKFGDPEEVTTGVFTDETTADEICKRLLCRNIAYRTS